VLGKIIGGGLPVGAITGPATIMDKLAPQGPVYQAGTLSGSPLAMASGIAALELISQEGFHAELKRQTELLCDGLAIAARDSGIPLAVNHVCGMFGMFFTEEQSVTRFSQVMACDSSRFVKFFHLMLAEGVNFAPSPFESGFVSSAHREAEINETIAAAARVFAKLGAER